MSGGCPLCGGSSSPFHEDKAREYARCGECGLIFVPKRFFATEQEEKAEYDLHENTLDDEGYLKFLGRAAQPVFEIFGDNLEGRTGLDFGCGPCPALASIFQKRGATVDLYDKFYFKNDAVMESENKYDFITATEVFEHLAEPRKIFVELWEKLKFDGILVVMTKRAEGSVEKFRNWHYKRDKTHICFFTDNTFKWVSQNLIDGELLFYSKDVVVLTKKRTTTQ
ncbi:methyltransferase [Angomonas deanei]|uniref:Methyltransferase domain containing protein, putative n=1 Tax=Angomonas deanei TaxID=59799 RepID=A0A7G2CU37_9TRYP|nr:methyltransferase [Angomonas deanei]CAD2222581.1 Methyltransferase domain containing protein, putative [Angomonas deanei]|eukprot:EPY42009.1 methyltransferase [Angomonas deanei]